MLLKIGEVSKRSGLPASTLRYYEEIGLVTPVGRSGIKRVYSADILEKLAFISLGRVAGLSLQDIGKMIGSGKIQVDRRLLLSKAEELDTRIGQLKAMRDGLRHAAECPAPSHLECPKFLRLLNIAGKRWSKSKPESKI